MGVEFENNTMDTPRIPPSPRVSPFKRYSRVNLRFKLPYYTAWGQNLMICGSDLLFGSGNIKQGVWLTPHHEGEQLVWQANVSVPENFQLEYKYVLVDEKLNVLKWEAGESRKLQLPEGLPDGAVIDVLDSWQDGASPEALLSKGAFRKVIFGKSEEDMAEPEESLGLLPSLQGDSLPSPDAVLLRFRIRCTRLEKGQKVYLVGSATSLGEWETDAALPLVHTSSSVWEADATIKRAEFPIRYKYILKDKEGQIVLEHGDDIELGLDTSARKPSLMIFVSDGNFRAAPWRGAGLSVPVFSIRSTEDVGSGEFLDLKLVVDFAANSGMRLVQLLPVNDTSVNGMWYDSYPYSSLSVFALHPLYLRLQALSDDIPSDIQAEIDHAKEELNLPAVDYDKTVNFKLSIAKKLFLKEKNKILSSTLFKLFFDENKEWLKPYAAFCFLKDLFGTSDHSQWGLHAKFSLAKLDKLVSPDADHYDSVAYRYYIQYHLHLQLSEAARYARKNRVILKGDLPIGVDRNSVDTWMAPTLFRMDTSTGAPPDMFDANGQNWGFPTYNWEEMSKDNYAWWRARLTQMAKYFSAYRIDHILGFFRIWELPAHANAGILGHFRPSIPISAEEMEKEGVWDFNRLSEPYIRPHLLQAIFEERWTEVATKYFEENAPSVYSFKEEYNTEKKIAASLKPREGSPDWLAKEMADTKQGLISLLTNICLIRDLEDPRKFYPRFDMESTASFSELDDHSNEVLKRLYQDYYFVRQEALWRENALKTLPVLMNSSDMLACGEDLGFVPACVPPVLNELGLLGLRIQRMPAGTVEFANPAEYEYMTVCAPSCHDCSTMRAWWEEDEGRRLRFFRTMLGYNGESSPDKCTPDVARAIIQQHCEAPSVWTIIPMQDLMALREEYCERPANEETINDPTNPRHYWRFRIHVPMETLIKDVELLSSIQELLLLSGRTRVTELPEDYQLSENTQVSNQVKDRLAALSVAQKH